MAAFHARALYSGLAELKNKVCIKNELIILLFWVPIGPGVYLIFTPGWY